MADSPYYYRLVSMLPGGVRRRFYSFTRYADGYIEAVLDEPEQRAVRLGKQARDEIRSLLFLKSLLFRLETAQLYAERALHLAQEAGMGGWSVGTVHFDSDSPELDAERRAVAEYRALLQEVGVAEKVSGSFLEVVRRLVREFGERERE